MTHKFIVFIAAMVGFDIFSTDENKEHFQSAESLNRDIFYYTTNRVKTATKRTY